MSDNDCPGIGKCHGCARWCDICGDDAATVCDDPACHAHPRGPDWHMPGSTREVLRARVAKFQAKARRLKRLVAKYKAERDAALRRRAVACTTCNGAGGFADRGDFIDCTACDGRGAVWEESWRA